MFSLHGASTHLENHDLTRLLSLCLCFCLQRAQGYHSLDDVDGQSRKERILCPRSILEDHVPESKPGGGGQVDWQRWR